MKRSVKSWLLGAVLGVGVLSTLADTYDEAEWVKEVKGTYTVGKEQTFTMPDSGELYYKLSGLSSGTEYTFIVSGTTNSEVSVLYTYKAVDTYEGGSDTYIYDSSIGYFLQSKKEGVGRYRIEKQSWIDEIDTDPFSEDEKKVKPTGYYLCVVGDPGTSVSVTSGKGDIAIPSSCDLTVFIKGSADATWSLKGIAGTHASGETVTMLNTQTVVFSKVAGLSTPANVTVTADEEGNAQEVTGVYKDTFDPKDDTVAGATKITPAAKVATASRTLLDADEYDHFAFAAKEGYYYNFSIEDAEGDAEITLFKKGGSADDPVTNGVTAISALKLAKGDYILRVGHGEEAGDVERYTLSYQAVNVGTISFAKTSVSAKKSAGSVTLTVNRSSAEGKVRVQFGTINGTAKPGVDYVPPTDDERILTWENGDKKAKTITIKLIPDAVATAIKGRAFTVALLPMGGELDEDEYLASIATGKGTATVTVTETAAKQPTAVKSATVTTEDVPLESGTYQGVIAADAGSLESGFAALASVTFTAKDVTTMKKISKALSAKVLVGGKTYTFTADNWETAETNDTAAVATLQSTARGSADTLRVTVVKGYTKTAGDWALANASVELSLGNVTYAGELYRDNSKVQDYLYAVTNAVGYYTIALKPTDTLTGVPAGNGYLTLTIDNKGKAKVAGLLADGSTKPSYTSIVTVQDDGDTLCVPVFVAKSPYCFGGTLRLVRLEEEGPYIVDPSTTLVWNNDNAALTYEGEEGWQAEIEPIGGYYNTIDNLQAHYLMCDLSVSFGDAGFLEEALPAGMEYALDYGPADTPVALAGNTLSTAKKSLVKDGKLVDLENSVNPYNVQVKFTRATGLVTGSFSLWTVNEAGTAQKELTGLKHNGILLWTRSDESSLDETVLTAGFFTQTATLKDEDTGKTRKYTASNPFNILVFDNGEPEDWYEDDWGEKPEAE